MAFDSTFKDRVRDASDIVQVIGDKISLKKQGSTYLGLCPFHPDRRPSMSVHPQRQFFKCWSCGKGGDVFTFLMDFDHLSFPEALENLAKRYGVPLPEGTWKDAVKSRDELLPLKDANAEAAAVFRKYLFVAKGALSARKYMVSRGLTKALAEKYDLGFAPEGWHFLEAALGGRIPEENLVKAGLLLERNGRRFDFFRNRLMFPIRNERGEVLGFGGRVIGQDEPKYLNTSETALFVKKRNLYGIHGALANLTRTKTAWVVEGYLDVIAAQESGFPAVAPLGTALTEEQIHKLRRWAEKIVFCFDGDEAGRKAAERSAALMVELGAVGEVILLPQGKDPFDVWREGGPEALKELFSVKAPNVYDFLLDRRVPVRTRSPGEVSRAAREIGFFIAQIRDETAKAAFSRQVADRLGVDLSALKRAPPRPSPAEAPRSVPDGRSEALHDAQKREIKENKLERDFVLFLCGQPWALGRARAMIKPENLEDRAAAWIYRHVLPLADRPKVSFSEILEAIPRESVREWLSRRLLAGTSLPPDKTGLERAFEDQLCALQVAHYRRKSLEVDRGLEEATMGGDIERRNRLLEEKMRIKQDILALRDYQADRNPS